MERVARVAPHPSKPQGVARLGSQALDASIDRPEWIRDGLARVGAEAADEFLAGAPQLICGRGVVEPGQAPVSHTVRREAEPAGLPTLDLRPVEVTKAPPSVADVPGVHLPDVPGDDECRGGEAKVREYGIGVLGEGGVAVIER